MQPGWAALLVSGRVCPWLEDEVKWLEHETEVSPSQPTAELVDGARY